jgi:hypothetical protein
MDSAIMCPDIGEALAQTLEGAGSNPLVVRPSHESIIASIDVLSDQGATEKVKLLADERVLKNVFNDFIDASRAADLVSEDKLAIRTLKGGPDNTLVVTDEGLVAFVIVTDAVAALSTDNEDFVASANGQYRQAWDDADDFSLRTPPLSLIRTSLADEIGPETADDFDGILASLETARGNGDGLDEVTISLLAAAKNRELLYDISKWGEDISLASKPTFSRAKSTLEDQGLIDTEKVPIDIGRPRLRLKFAAEELKEADADEISSVAMSLLSN